MDIRDEALWHERRWRWDEHGYSSAFPKKITPTDIDMLVERNGYFLAVETKEWVPFTPQDKPPVIPEGQLIALKSMAQQPKWSVFYVAGEAATGAPWYIEQIGGTAYADLRMVESVEERRAALYGYFETWAKFVEDKKS